MGGDMDNEAVAPGAGVAIVEACSEMVTTPSTTDKKGAVETVVAGDTILVTPAPSGGTASESIGDKNIGAAAPAPESNNVILEACSEDEILPIVVQEQVAILESKIGTTSATPAQGTMADNSIANKATMEAAGEPAFAIDAEHLGPD